MKMKNLSPVIVLAAICLVAALLLALVNTITAPIIDEARNQAANEALLVVLPDGANFEKIELDERYPAIVQDGYRADGGFVFRMSVTGKSAGLVIMCGINADGKIVGTTVIENQETPSYAEKVFPAVEGLDGAYKDKTLSDFEPYLVSGATLTSRAYGEAVNAALQAFEIANGREVDIRTPEQILAENCNTALGTEGLAFTRWFATEVISGVDAVYVAADNSGYVFASGESFVGVKADGTIVDLGSADEQVIKAAFDAVSGASLAEVTTLPEGINTTLVKKVSVSATGNYVFELETKGYQCLTEWHGSNVPIRIRLSIAADGKIIDCLTVSHDETEGYGDACATEEYYAQYRGVAASDVKVTVSKPDNYADQIPADNTDVGVLASATFTTAGYQKAVKAAFEAFEILNAGGDAQ